MAKKTNNTLNDCFLPTGELHIHDGNWQRFVEPPRINGRRMAKGLIPRDYTTTHYKGAVPGLEGLNIPLVPKGEWSDRIRQQEKDQARLSDIRNQGMNGQRIPARDQGNRGYCWAHSGVSGMLIVRAKMGQPYADLSAYSVACKIKNFADEGGWGAQGADFLIEYGCATSKTWPQQGTKREYDKPETWEEAKHYRFTEAWNDLSMPQYDRNLTFEQVATCLLNGLPVIVDMSWWSHSICAIDLVETSSGQFGLRILNSWSDSWSEGGTGILSGSKAIPDGAVAPRDVVPFAP